MTTPNDQVIDPASNPRNVSGGVSETTQCKKCGRLHDDPPHIVWHPKPHYSYFTKLFTPKHRFLKGSRMVGKSITDYFKRIHQ